MSGTAIPSSFRDPAGFLWAENGKLFRQVNESYRVDYDHLIASGLYDELTASGSMIPHREVPIDRAPSPGAYKVLEPELVRFVSYPYEWCFDQLRDAALLTLDIQETALSHGMSLRDASAYNVQFHDGRPVLIDTLSFEVLREGKPWIAYRQFCQHFLAPLALMAFRDERLGGLLRNHIDGVPLDLASRLLPRSTRRRPSLQLHIHAHARSQKRYEARDVGKKVGSRAFSVQAMKGLVASLRRATTKMKQRSSGPSSWSDYYAKADHYSDEAFVHKRSLVADFLAATEGPTVWDLGGNIGLFSREAAKLGRNVVCFEVDRECVGANYRRVKQDGEKNVLPLVCDLTNPSPGIGWALRERSSLVERGSSDVLLALALVHHLAIGNNVPLDLIAGFLADIGRWLIIEFVPKEDPMTQQLLKTRTDIFDSYTREGFEDALRKHFSISRAEPIDATARILYLARNLRDA